MRGKVSAALLEQNADGEYVYDSTARALELWQASRRAALTAAAEVCDAKHDEYYERDYYKCAELRMTADEGCRSCEQAILALRDGGGG